MLLITAIFCLTVIINVPFGYLRSKAKKFSLKWLLYIHLPVPFIFMARTFSHIGYQYIPIFIVAGVIGQICGGKIES